MMLKTNFPHSKFEYQIFDEQPEVDGIFACGDLPAFSLITEAKKRGINIPNDLKIIGYDGTKMIQTLVPELTTIQQPIKLIAQTAIDILLKEISGDYTNIPSETRLPVKLIEGFTT